MLNPYYEVAYKRLLRLYSARYDIRLAIQAAKLKTD